VLMAWSATLKSGRGLIVVRSTPREPNGLGKIIIGLCDLEQDHPYTDNSGFADFMDSEDAFAELLRRSAQAQANRRGHDLAYRLQLSLLSQSPERTSG